MTTVDTTSSASAAAASTSQAATAKVGLGKDLNTFLNMLTTQLKHQDPLSPMDSTQFTSQLVQYSSVEQQINANSNLEKLITLQQNSQASQATNYLGQLVELSGSSLPLQGGTASFSYTLPENANSVTLQIKDSTGKVVSTKTGDLTAGRHDVSWDGTDNSGTQLKDGLYTVNVIATKGDGSALTTTNTVFGEVNKVTNDATNGTQLEMDAGSSGAKLTTTLDKIISVAANNTVSNAQLTAANAQYLAAQAQYKALQAAAANTTTTQ